MSPANTEGSEVVVRIFCPRCGITEGKDFCKNCGMKRRPEEGQKFLCFHCNKSTEGKDFCSGCGAKRISMSKKSKTIGGRSK